MKRQKTQDLIVAEEKDKGGVSFQDVRNFLSFSCGDFGIFLYLFASLWPAICALGFTLWMGYWAQ